MNGVTRSVRRRSLSSSMVLAAISPGTLHPKPLSIGMNALPGSPSAWSGLSMMNAALARYPVSSSNERTKKRIQIFGRNTRTEPTPEMTPSPRIEPSIPGIVSTVNAASQPTTVSIIVMNGAPNVKVRSNAAHISARKIGMPSHLSVRTWSRVSEGVTFAPFPFRTFPVSALIAVYLLSAMSASASSGLYAERIGVSFA